MKNIISIPQLIDKIENADISDFIDFAKNYNIFQDSNSKFYDEICNKIKARLDREGLDYEIVRPE